MFTSDLKKIKVNETKIDVNMEILTSVFKKIDIIFFIYINTLLSRPLSLPFGLNLSLLRHCNSSVFSAIVSLSRCCNPFLSSTRYWSSTRDAVNSSLFFELKLSRSRFLLFLLPRFLKVSPKSKLILAHITFSLSVLFWINLSYLMCVVWLGANVVRNLLSYHNESMPLRQSTSLLYCNHRMITEISCLFTKVEIAS